MDGQILAGNIAKAKNPADFKIVGEVLSVEPIAIMMRKDDPAFKKAVDDSIKAMIKSGELAKIYDKWFMQPIPPSQHQGRPAGQRRHQGGLGQPERQAGRGVREEVADSPQASPEAGWRRACLCCDSAAPDHSASRFFSGPARRQQQEAAR